MSQQPSYQGNSVDQQLIDEFIQEFITAKTAIESLLLSLENNPQDHDLLNSLFREFHTIKGNSHFIGLNVISDFVHSLETVLDQVRKDEISFDKLLGDVAFEALDLIGEYCKLISAANADNSEDIRELENKFSDHTKSLDKSFNENSSSIQNILLEHTRIVGEVNSEQLEDLKFFASIIQVTEQRTPFWKGRTQRLLNIALELNSQAGQVVNSAQLEAAVYLHDIGMAFLPLDIINENKFLSEREHQIVKSHPALGATLLGENPIWKDAATIIMQHHEREDGKGYPNGLRSEQICNGAKILAIADAFETLTNRRDSNSIRYPVTQAIADINGNAGTQFATFWVSIFNDVIRKKTTKS